MPYDSNGNASVTRSIAVTGQTVLAEQVNVPFADIQAMLGQVLLKSGVAPMTGPLNMNQSKIINVSDPTLATDGANKEYVDAQVSTVNSGISSNARKIETVNANRLALLADKATSFRVTGARTITLTAAATLLANWWCEVWAVDGQVTIDPDAAETINGNATLILNAGQKAIVFCTGTAFFAFVTSDAQSGVQLQGYSFGLALSNNASDAANDIDITSGKSAADTSPFSLMVLNSAITKRIDALWAVGSGNGGLDTGGVSASGTYYIWLIQRSDTGVTDALFSLSNTAPTMPSGYDRKRLIGNLIREVSVNGPASPSVGFTTHKRNPSITPDGVAATFSGIPPSAQKVAIKFNGFTLSALTVPLVKVGNSGGIISTGYLSTCSVSNGGSTNFDTTSIPLWSGSDNRPVYGILEFSRMCPGSTKWVAKGLVGRGINFLGTIVSNIDVDLSQIQISTTAGNIALGGERSISIEWEF